MLFSSASERLHLLVMNLRFALLLPDPDEDKSQRELVDRGSPLPALHAVVPRCYTAYAADARAFSPDQVPQQRAVSECHLTTSDNIVRTGKAVCFRIQPRIGIN